jgi:hypothetical protein
MNRLVPIRVVSQRNAVLLELVLKGTLLEMVIGPNTGKRHSCGMGVLSVLKKQTMKPPRGI